MGQEIGTEEVSEWWIYQQFINQSQSELAYTSYGRAGMPNFCI